MKKLISTLPWNIDVLLVYISPVELPQRYKLSLWIEIYSTVPNVLFNWKAGLLAIVRQLEHPWWAGVQQTVCFFMLPFPNKESQCCKILENASTVLFISLFHTLSMSNSNQINDQRNATFFFLSSPTEKYSMQYLSWLSAEKLLQTSEKPCTAQKNFPWKKYHQNDVTISIKCMRYFSHSVGLEGGGLVSQVR